MIQLSMMPMRNSLHFIYLFIYSFIYFGEREEGWGERERNIDLLFHLFMHYWLLFVCVLTEDQTHNLGVSGYHCNRLSYLGRA